MALTNKAVDWLINTPLAKNVIIGFIFRQAARLLSENPNDFKWYQLAGKIITAWVGLPMLLTYFNIAIPVWLPHWENSTALIVGMLTTVLTQLGVKDDSVLIPRPVAPVGDLQVSTIGQLSKLDAALQDYAAKYNLVLTAVQAEYNNTPTFKTQIDAAYSIS